MVRSEQLFNIMNTCNSWSELHARLALIGASYDRYGSGGSIISITDETGEIIKIKPSSIHRNFSFCNMKKRLGDYVISENKKYERKSKQINEIVQDIVDEDKRIYSEYQVKTEKLLYHRRKIMDCVRNFGNTWHDNDTVCNSIKEMIDDKIDDDTKRVTLEYKHKIVDLGKKIYFRAFIFEIWIKEHRGSDKSDNSVQFTLSFPETHDFEGKKAAFLLYHGAVQANRYRICIKNSNADRKTNYLGHTKEDSCPAHSPEYVIEHIKDVSWWESKLDEHIYYSPISDDKEHILVDDASKETLQKMKSDGLMPNCIIESSPNNYQVLFTLTKPILDHDNADFEYQKKAFTDLAHGLNMQYGDVALCGIVHPHRAPGYYNIKQKYRRADGTYPIVNVKEAQPVECCKLIDFIIFATGYYKYRAEEHKLHSKNFRKQFEMQNCTTVVNEKEKYFSCIYKTHYADIIKIFTRKYGHVKFDRSIVDYKIVQRLICLGYSQIEIESILEYSPKYSNETEKRKRHNICFTVSKAFNTMTDDFVNSNKYWINQWKVLEEKAVDNYIQNKEEIKLDKPVL